MTKPHADIETFRTRYRLDLLERLVLQGCFQAWLLAGLTADQCQSALENLLAKDALQTDTAFGEYFGDPALAALFSDEALEIQKQISGRFAKLVEIAKKHGR